MYRDIPKNTSKAMQLLEIARNKDSDQISFKEQKDLEFFEIMLKRLNSQNRDDPTHFWELNSELKALAEEGHPNAMFAYGKELYHLCENNVLQDRQLVNDYLGVARDYILNASLTGVKAANYYLGQFLENGIAVTKNVDLAFEHYVEGAAGNNAM